MEATFVLHPREANPQLIEQMLQLFADSSGPVTVQVTTQPKLTLAFQSWFQGMESIRAETEKVPVLSEIGDLDDLIDAMNEVEL